jgi:pimeloyl-ACP methyl ester carboxylesterase
MTAVNTYTAIRQPISRFIAVRGINVHCLVWGEGLIGAASRPPLVLLHGWMDVAASFQFMVDAMADDRLVIAADWRGYGMTTSPPVDSYWFADYLGDLDALLDSISPEQPVDLLGHSMGGNVAMIYAGVRPQRVRRLINLEGFGMPATQPEQAGKRLAQWLDQLKVVQDLRDYDSPVGVAQRLMKTNPRLSPDKAAWLALHWAAPDSEGRWKILGDPAHKRVNPLLSRLDETLAIWRQISAPVLWVEGDSDSMRTWWAGRYTRPDFESRLEVIAQLERRVLPQAGHMLHHDQPGLLAAAVEAFLD